MRTRTSTFPVYRTVAFLLLTLVAASGCIRNHGDTSSKVFSPIVDERSREDYVDSSEKAMVVTAHPFASEAGLKMLRGGGNAVDAAVAASFVISVVRPQSTGIGGGGFLLNYVAEGDKTEVWDFRERAPLKATRDMYLDKEGNPKGFEYKGETIPNASVNGHLAAGTPGLVAGLVKLHAEHGELDFATVIEPAVDLAEKGFPVYEDLAEAIERRADVMKHFEGTRKVFFKDGKPLQAGDPLVQKDLAWTLKRIRDHGAAGFYEGPVAKKIVQEMERGGGLISQKDLESYEVKMRDPVAGTYRGYKIASMPPPSSGGTHIVQMLNILEGYDYGSFGHNTTKSTHLLAETMRRAYADRAEYLGDPDFVDVPVDGLTSPKYANHLRKSISLKKATPSSALEPGNPVPYESSSTTHLSVVDSEGNAVSSTQTINYTFGSGVVADGTGVVLNDEMDDFSKKPGVPNAYGLLGSEANAIAAKKTMLSSMSPTLVFDKEGELYMVVGSPGGPRIITATLQTIINTLDHGMSLPDAVHAKRIHHQWYPDEIRIEEFGLPKPVRSELEKMGHTISVKGAIGDVQAIKRQEKGWLGVSDTRSTGQPAGL